MYNVCKSSCKTGVGNRYVMVYVDRFRAQLTMHMTCALVRSICMDVSSKAITESAKWLFTREDSVANWSVDI